MSFSQWSNRLSYKGALPAGVTHAQLRWEWRQRALRAWETGTLRRKTRADYGITDAVLNQALQDRGQPPPLERYLSDESDLKTICRDYRHYAQPERDWIILR